MPDNLEDDPVRTQWWRDIETWIHENWVVFDALPAFAVFDDVLYRLVDGEWVPEDRDKDTPDE